jgi:hypothetical protein
MVLLDMVRSFVRGCVEELCSVYTVCEMFFQMLSAVGFEDMSSCLADTTARHGRHAGNIM